MLLILLVPTSFCDVVALVIELELSDPIVIEEDAPSFEIEVGLVPDVLDVALFEYTEKCISKLKDKLVFDELERFVSRFEEELVSDKTERPVFKFVDELVPGEIERLDSDKLVFATGTLVSMVNSVIIVEVTTPLGPSMSDNNVLVTTSLSTEKGSG